MMTVARFVLPTTSTNPEDIIRAMNRFPKKFQGGIKSLGFVTN
jgi:hypothetical protein